MAFTFSPLVGEQPQHAQDNYGDSAGDAQGLDLCTPTEIEKPHLVLYEIRRPEVEIDWSGDEPDVHAVCHHDGGSGLDLLSDFEFSDDASEEEVPDTMSVESDKSTASLPSVGSDGHASGLCRPCAHFSRKGCFKGNACEFCHICTYESFLSYKSMRKARKQQTAKYKESQSQGPQTVTSRRAQEVVRF
eukprot:TRINITY_DN11315_c0_g2_i3.p1 TRINITY_DN11315_c0_g2~~TRINITY_DN11315_c0_g2_i3.p1  ORF type:complete len:189 (+),score=31.85 TRINITY_DN11315_c0_g2_i3:207-773(+)